MPRPSRRLPDPGLLLAGATIAAMLAVTLLAIGIALDLLAISHRRSAGPPV